MTDAIFQSKKAQAYLLFPKPKKKRTKPPRKVVHHRWGGEGEEDESDMDLGVTETGF